MKKQGKKLISAILVVIMTASVILQTDLIGNAEENSEVQIKEQLIGLDQGLPTYRETIHVGSEPTLPEKIRVIVAMEEQDEAETASQDVVQAEADAFTAAQPPQEYEQLGYEKVEGKDNLYLYCYDKEIDVTQEVETGCVFIENDTYVAYRCYGSLNGAADEWYACDAEGSLIGAIREIPVTWESNGTFDAGTAGVYAYTADEENFAEYDLQMVLPVAEITVVEPELDQEQSKEAEEVVEAGENETPEGNKETETNDSEDTEASGEEELETPEASQPEEIEGSENEGIETPTDDEASEQPEEELSEEQKQEAIDEMNNIARNGITIVPFSAGRADIYWNPDTSDVIDTLTGNTVGKGGNDSNSGNSEMAPLLTWSAVKAEAAAHSNYVNIIIMTQVNVTNNPSTTQIDSVVNGGGVMEFSQWSYSAGIMFIIQPGASFELSNTTVDCSLTSGGAAIFLADNNTTSATPSMGTFTIGDGLYIINGMIELEMDHTVPGKIATPPVVLATTTPADNYVLYLTDMITNEVFNECDIIATPGPSGGSYLSYFSLDSRNTDEDWTLSQSTTSSATVPYIWVQKVLTWEGVFIDGQNGNDANFGGNERKPVKTFARAKQIVAQQVALGYEWNIYICDTVNITGTESWDLPAGGIYGTDPKVLPCFNHIPDTLVTVKSGGTLTLTNITICYDQVIARTNQILNLEGGSTCNVNAGATLTGEYASGQANTTTIGILLSQETNTAANLTIDGGNIEWLSYGIYSSGNSSSVYATYTCIMDGGKISNCVNDGIYVYNYYGRGKRIDFTMNGGEISNNQGRGFYTFNYYSGSVNSLTLNGGDITNNQNGGIYMYLSASLTMTGGKVSDNSTSSGYGAGIYSYAGGAMTISGGEITDNTTTGGTVYGGGICRYGVMTLSGGKVNNNMASSTGAVYGGGVYCTTTITYSSGTVNDNTAIGTGAVYGGGIYASIVTYTGGEVNDNTAESTAGIVYGGGIYGNVTMSGSSTVNNNKAIAGTQAYGGGIYGSSYLIFNGGTTGTIINNAATGTTDSHGGGIYVGYLRMDGGTIGGNAANNGTQCYLTSTNMTSDLYTNELIAGTITGSGSDISTIYFAATTTAAYSTRAWIGFDPVNMNLTGNFYFNSTYEYIKLYNNVPAADRVAGRWIINLNTTPEVFDVGSILVRTSGSATITVGSNSYTRSGATASNMSLFLTCFSGGTLPDTPNKTMIGMYSNMIVLLGEGVYLDGTSGNDSNTGDSPTAAVKTWSQAVTLLKSKIAAADASASNTDGMSPYIYVCGMVSMTATTTLTLDYDASDLTPIKNTRKAEVRKFTPYTGILFQATAGTITFGKMTFNGMTQNATDAGTYDITISSSANLYMTNDFAMETYRAVSLTSRYLYMQGNASISVMNTGEGVYGSGSSRVYLQGTSSVNGGGNTYSTTQGAIRGIGTTNIYLQGNSKVTGSYRGVSLAGTASLTMTVNSEVSSNTLGVYAGGTGTITMQGSSTVSSNSYGIYVDGASTVTMQGSSTVSLNSYGIYINDSGATVSMYGTSSITGTSAGGGTGVYVYLTATSTLATPIFGMYENSKISNVGNGVSGSAIATLTRTVVMMGQNGVLTDTPTISSSSYGIVVSATSTSTYGTTSSGYTGKVILQGMASVSRTATYSSSGYGRIHCNMLYMYDSATVKDNITGTYYSTSLAVVDYLNMQDNTEMKLDAPTAYPSSNAGGVVTIYEGGELTDNVLISNDSIPRPNYGYDLAGIYYRGAVSGQTLTIQGNVIIEGASGAGITTGYTSGTGSSSNPYLYNYYGSLVVQGNAEITDSGTYGIYDAAPAAESTTKTGTIVLAGQANIYGNNTRGTVSKGASVYINRYGTLQIAGTITLDDEIYLESFANPIKLSSAIASTKTFLVGCGRSFLGNILVTPTSSLTSVTAYLARFVASSNFISGSSIVTKTGDVNLWVSATGTGDIYLAGDEVVGDTTANPGKDTNDGLTPGTPVRTFARAKALLKTMPSGTNIVICSRVNIIPTGTSETWSFDAGGYFTNNAGQTWQPMVQRIDGLTDALISICKSGVTVEFKDITIDGNAQNVSSAAPLIVNGYTNVTLILGDNAILQNNARDTSNTVTWKLFSTTASDPNYQYREFNYSTATTSLSSSAYSAVVMLTGTEFRMEDATIRGMTNYGAVQLSATDVNFNSGSICDNFGYAATLVNIGANRVYFNNVEIYDNSLTSGNLCGVSSYESYFRDIEIYDNNLTTGTILSVSSNYNSSTLGYDGTVFEGSGSIHDNYIGGTDSSVNGVILALQYGAKLGGSFQISNNTIKASPATGYAYANGQIINAGYTYDQPCELTDNFTIQGNQIAAESVDSTSSTCGRIINIPDWTDSEFVMNGGLIADNVIEGDTLETSGGVYISYFTKSATFNAGTIRGNKCIGSGSRGAGLFINCLVVPSYGGDTPVTLRGTTIINNEADQGAGIYMWADDSVVSGMLGGMSYSFDRLVEIYSGTISNNKPAGVSGTARGDQSGIYVGGTNFRLKGSSSIINDYMYLASNAADTRITLSGLIYNPTRIYNVDVGPDFDRGDVVVKPDGDVVLNTTSYLKNFNLGTDAFVLEKASPNLVLMQYMFIDSLTGNDANTGTDPLNAKATWAGATSNNTASGLAIYISGPVYVTGAEYWELPSDSVATRYTGFSVKGVSYPAYEGHLVELDSGDDLTIGPVLIQGRRDQDSSLLGGKAMFYVGSGADLTLTEDVQLINNLNTQDNKGGAVYNDGGTTYIDGASLVGMVATEGADVYQAGQLTLAKTPQISGEIYVAGTGTSDTTSHKIDVEDSFSLSSGQKITIAIENAFDTRHVVEYVSGHIPTAAEQEYYELKSNISALFIMQKRSGAESILELWLKSVIYIDGVNGSDTNSGSAPLQAVKTFYQAYQLLSTTTKGGVLMVVDTVTIPSGVSMTLKNTSLQSQYFEGPESSPTNTVTITGEVSIRRYVQPTAWSSLTAPLNPADFNKVSNQNALVYAASGAELTVSRLYVDGGNQSLGGDVQYAGPAVTADEAMLIINGGRLDATSSVFYRNTNGSAGGLGGGISILNDVSSYGSCRLSDVTMEDNYVTGSGSKGSAIYHDGEVSGGLTMDRSIEIDGEIHLTGSGNNSTSRRITIERTGFMQVSAGNYLNITLDDSYLTRSVVEYPNTYTPTAADDIPVYILEPSVQAIYSLGNRSGAVNILELQATRRVYIDGVNGSDTNAGDVPIRAVATLEKAYELLKGYNGGHLYVVNTVTISSYVSLTETEYTDGVTTHTVTGGTVEIRRYNVPDSYIWDSQYNNWSSVANYQGTLFEVANNGVLQLSDLVVSGEKNPRDSTAIYGTGGNPHEDYTAARTVQAATIEVKSGGNLIMNADSQLIDNNNISTSKYGGAIENYGTVDQISGVVKDNSAVKGAGIYQGGSFNIITGADGYSGQQIYLVTDSTDRVINLSEHIYLGSGVWNILDVDMDNAVDGRNVATYDFNATLADEIDGYNIPATTLLHKLVLVEADPTTEPNTLELYLPVVDIKFTKVAAENTSLPLEGVKFKVYELTCTDPTHNHASSTTQVNDIVDSTSIAAGCWTPLQTSGMDNIYTSASATGLVDIGTLEQGLYMLVELETVTGYALPDGQWMITTDGMAGDTGSGDYKLEFTAKTHNNLPPAVIRDTSGSTVSYKVVNAKPFTLPLSGGGPRTLIILGVIIMVASLGGYYFHNRRKRRKEQA